MSQWRRIAMGEVPTCKKVIEAADNPYQMWIHLWQEACEAYEEGEEGKSKLNEIFKFVALCEKRKFPESLSKDVWMFYHYIVGAFVVGNESVRADLPHRISIKEFLRWAGGIGFSPDTIEKAKKAFR